MAEFNIIQGVPCDHCKTIHALESETFIAFHGNVTTGAKKGVYGSKDGKKVTVLCKKSDCLIKLLNNLDDVEIDEEVEQKEENIEKDSKIEDSPTNDEEKSNNKAFDPEAFKDK